MVAFLSFRPALLHKSDSLEPAWPSPRSWEMASQLHAIGLEVAAAIGAPAASEFNAFVALYRELPNLEQIMDGHGDGVSFPDEPSVRYATTVGLTARAADAQQAYHALRWLTRVAASEWVQLCAADMFLSLIHISERRPAHPRRQPACPAGAGARQTMPAADRRPAAAV